MTMKFQISLLFEYQYRHYYFERILAVSRVTVRFPIIQEESYAVVNI